MRYDVAKLSADHLDKAQVRYNWLCFLFIPS
jgi:hypothetical protein